MAKPEMTLVARVVIENDAQSSGSLVAVYDVVVGLLTGKAVFRYGWRKRDVEEESLYCSPAVAVALKDWCPEEGPSVVLDSACSSKGDPAVIRHYDAEATERIYDIN